MITSFDQLDLTKQYTYSDYLTWKFDEMVELINGYVFKKMSPAPLFEHQDVSINLSTALKSSLKKEKFKILYAPFDVRLKNNIVVQPDICVICDLTKIDEKGCNGAPDLIIEILSPSTAKYDTKTKFEIYQQNGVKEYWIVQPRDQLIDVFVLENDQYKFIKKYNDDDLLPSMAVPNLTIDLKEVFLK